MEPALAYNQSDIYKIAERRAVGVRPLFEELENFDFETGDALKNIENFVYRCGRSLDILSTVMTGIAAAGTPLDGGTLAWLFELTRNIDRHILENPAFERMEPGRRAEIRRNTEDLAYAIGIIDLRNSETINSVLARRGLGSND